jgi:hypothetical protein
MRLTLGSAHAELINRSSVTLVDRLSPVLVVLGVSILVAAVLALVLRSALRIMSPTSENTSMLLLALVAAATTVAAHMGGSAPLAALLARHADQADAPAPLGLASAVGQRLVHADHADVCAGVHRGRAGRLECAGGRCGAGPDSRAPAGQGRGRGPGQRGQRCQLAPGAVGRHAR